MLERLLNEMPGAEKKFETINAGISGATAAGLLARYRDEWLPRHGPDLVVIDLSHNDLDLGQFGQALLEFLGLNHQAGIDTVLVLEPNSCEDPSPHLAGTHAVMRLSPGGWACH